MKVDIDDNPSVGWPQGLEGYVHMTWPRGRKEAIVIVGGTPDNRRVSFNGTWYNVDELLTKGYTFSKPIGLTLALENALRITVTMAMANETMLSMLDKDGSLKRAVDEFQKVLALHGAKALRGGK